MLTTEERMEIAVLKRHGTSIRAIARATGPSRNTVRRYLRGGDEASTSHGSTLRQRTSPSSDALGASCSPQGQQARSASTDLTSA